MERSLKEQVVLVTGSARRVGKAILLAFAREGAHVVIHHSQSDEAAQATAHEAQALGVKTLIVKGDHRHHEAISANFEQIRQTFGRVDVLVNSASIFPSGNLLDISPEDWETTLGINLSAPFWCLQQAARIMREAHIQGSIINIGDNGGLRPWDKRPHHGISKAGVIMLTQVAAKALGEYGIRVNCVVPGPVLPAPDMSADFWDGIVAQLPLARSGEPDDVARAAVFLAKNDFISGAILRVDGGEYLGA